MGFNNELAGRVVFDLEAVACPDAREFLDPIKAPRHYKDVAKIAAYAEEKLAEIIGDAALDPDLCEIVAVGFMDEDEPEPRVWTRADVPEIVMLKMAWECLRDRAVIGHNVLGYDFPVLIRRSQLLGIAHPAVNLDKYRTPHVDLQQKLSFNGARPWRSLSFYKRRFKLDVPDDPVKGEDIARLVAAGDWAAVKQHCYCDLLTTAALARRLGYLTQPVRLGEAASF